MSQKSTFTPGPWKYQDGRPFRAWEIYAPETSPMVIAEVRGSELLDLDRAEADARLIAAAPDLLQALINVRALAAYITPSEVSRRFGEIAQNAIALARQEESLDETQ